MKKNIEQDAQYAAQLSADATREKLAEIYADALLGAKDAMNASGEQLWEEYDSFLRDVCDPYPKFEEILATPSVPVEEKLRIVDELCVDCGLVFRNFLKTLAWRGRMDMLREIRVACRTLDDRRRGIVPVRISVAAPVSDELCERIAQGLREKIGGEPRLIVETDPELIGGLIVRVGDLVCDASVATQLNQALQEMINRSAHEIQSRRNCFSNTEGN